MFLIKTLLVTAALTGGLLSSPPAAAKPGRVPEPAMTPAIVDRPHAYVLVDPNIDETSTDDVHNHLLGQR